MEIGIAPKIAARPHLRAVRTAEDRTLKDAGDLDQHVTGAAPAQDKQEAGRAFLEDDVPAFGTDANHWWPPFDKKQYN
jgi:hypothetical protein